MDKTKDNEFITSGHSRRDFFPFCSTYGQSSKYESAEEEYANHQNPEITLKHNLSFSSQSLSWHSKPLSRTANEAWQSFSIIARPPQVEPLTISEMAQKESTERNMSFKNLLTALSISEWLRTEQRGHGTTFPVSHTYHAL